VVGGIGVERVEEASNKEYTIRDVAHLAGVSTATAGRVLGGYGSASKKTMKAVLEAAEKINYIPNAIAQSMKKKNTYTIGLLIANIANPFYSTIARALEEHLMKQGYNMIICNTDEDLDREISYIKTLYEKRIDGIIIASVLKGSEMSRDEVNRIYNGSIPTIILDREIPDLELPTVTSDNFGGAYEATSHLIRMGHTRIGIIGTTISTLSQRVEGYKKALDHHNIPFQESFISDKDLTNIQVGDVKEGYNKTITMLTKNGKKPTAILALNNLLTFGALLAIQELGLNIPREIAIIGWDDFDLAPLLQPPLTVVRQNPFNIASITANRLLDLINGVGMQDSTDQKIVLSTQLIVRGSCGQLG
jgi:DNA-binding LacI/PurR family transcriptional regulator